MIAIKKVCSARNDENTFTGASSALGARLLQCLLAYVKYSEIWCVQYRRQISVSSPKMRIIEADLENDATLNVLPSPLDLVVQCAGLTHSQDERRYWKVNFEGTIRLAARTRELGCRRFVFISTRATRDSGAYGESKLDAELELQKLAWQSLLIIRPAEVYGGLGTEGIDRLMQIATKWHVVPMLWGDRRLLLAPLHINDFAIHTAALIDSHVRSVKAADLCGPESVSTATMAWRIARRCKALPLPVWWPSLTFGFRLMKLAGFSPLAPDQFTRLVSKNGNTIKH